MEHLSSRKNIQNIDFQQNVTTFKKNIENSLQNQISPHLQKKIIHLSLLILLNLYSIYTIKCKEPIHFKSRPGKTIHFPVKNYLNLHFELEDNTKFYPSIPSTYILQKFKDNFHFLDMIINDKTKDSCSTVIRNSTLARGVP